jgi:type IV pilus assembly protein PilY1
MIKTNSAAMTPPKRFGENNMNSKIQLSKIISSMLISGFYFVGIQSATAASLNISQKPLILSESVSPNMLLTIDDSGSMRWAFAPDNAGTTDATRRAKSNTFNPMYYNPNVTYTAPKVFNSLGSEVQLATSFTSALHNGFSAARGTTNLSNNYRVHWTYNPSQNAPTAYGFVPANDTDPKLAENPIQDFGASVIRNSNGTSAFTSPSGIIFSINRTSSTTCTASASYPSIFSNLPTSCTRTASNTFTATLNRSGVPAYYYRYDAGKKANCVIGDDDCYTLTFVSTTEQQNFANWYSFYRNRALATVSAAALAFYDLSSEVRLSWQGLTSCTSFTSTDPNSTCRNNTFKPYNSAHKGQLYTWLQGLTFSGGTPLPNAMIRAGEFYRTNVRAWEKNPGGTGNTANNTYACRPSYHIMMTDGIWGTDASSTPADYRHDNLTFILPDNINYTGRAPYQDSQNNTLADLAMHYWATDLRPTVDNSLKAYTPYKSGNTTTDYWDPRNNPATWQHMTNFIMGLGLTQSLTNTNIPWEGGTHDGKGYQALLDGTATWPPASRTSVNNVYDLWHSAINSRGDFFSVDSPEAMVQAFREILNRIADRSATAARPAVSASFVSDNINQLQSRVYATQFSSEDWSGEVTKITITKAGEAIAGQSWSTRTANANLDPNLRKVLIKDPSNSTTGLKNFSWSNLTTTQQGFLNVNPEGTGVSSDSRGPDRLNYIRGDRTKEGENSPQFRQRSTILGDIINSSPALVGTPAYISYLADGIEKPDRGAGYKDYTKFREDNKRSNRKEMLYVGGNDGMLHGFESDTGKEIFAFIPSAVMQNLNKLSGQNYKGGEHRYFVDGSPIVRDVYFDNTLGWRTVLIGTLRAGGKAMFALDVTDPNNIKLLWEFDSSNDVDLGYTFAQPEIVRLHTGQWAVLKGNGYNSTNDKAALLVIDIRTGALLKKIVVPPVVEANVTLPNGLSSVRAADNNGDGLADYAYAGDLQGNLWRFDLVPTTTAEDDPTSDPFNRNQNFSNSNSFTPAQFKLSYGNEPLFVARDAQGLRQPITIQPSLVRHPTNLGYLVMIGTGKYFENGDANVDTSREMSLYGIWDRKTRRQTTQALPANVRVRANLQKQQFEQQQIAAQFDNNGTPVSNDIRILSQNSVKWFRDLNIGDEFDPTDDGFVEKWGWRLDLAVENNGNQALAGEMIVNNMAARGTTLLASSLTPNDDPCQAGAITWFYDINAHTGGRTLKNVLDLNNDRRFDSKDQYQNQVVTGRRFSAPGGFTMSPGGVFGEGGEPPMTLPPIIGAPRQSWHIIPEDVQ